MFLLIRCLPVVLVLKQVPLHSNMFLLILLRGHFGVISPDFTFQYVSINTNCFFRRQFSVYTLHSNMFLLIPVLVI